MKKNNVFYKIKKICSVLTEITHGRWIFVLISAILPLLIMVIFGIVLAIKYDHGLALSLAIVLTLFPIAIPLAFISHAQKKELELNQITQKDQAVVLLSSEWSEEEINIFERTQGYIKTLNLEQLAWKDLDSCVLQVLEQVAQGYQKKSLDFTIPEALTLFEEIGRRYKNVITEHLPGIELIKLSHLKSGIDIYSQYGELANQIISAALLANNIKNLYFNPLKAAVDIAKQHTSSSMSKEVFSALEYKAKSALLEEVAAVAIDLYSGRFTLNANALELESENQDDHKKAHLLSPLKIAILGQTNAGKSSLINALKNEFTAETDLLPSTAATSIHPFVYQENEFHFIDLKGLDGESSSFENQLDEMKQADLILWVLKANQSAKALDVQLKEAFSAFYLNTKHISCKKPRIIAVLSHIDELPPRSHWCPPFDLTQPKNSKENTINEALAYNQALLKPDVILPLSIAINKPHFGLGALKEQLIIEMQNAINVQLNRRRNKAINKGKSVKHHLKQSVKAGKKIAPKAIKSAFSFKFKS